MKTAEVALAAAPEETTPVPLNARLVEIYANVGEKGQKRIQDYGVLVRHTGNYLAKSMSIAYAKGVNDTIQLLLKEITNEQK